MRPTNRRSLRPSDNPFEIARSKLWEKLRAGFLRLLEVNQLTLAEAESIPHPLRLPGMKELRAEMQLSERTFRNWWRRFKWRVKGQFRPSGRRHGFSQKSAIADCVKWLGYQFDGHFRRLAHTYSSREMWDTCRAAKGFPTCSYRTFRRALVRAKRSSKTQSAWHERKKKIERRKRYLREREKLLKMRDRQAAVRSIIAGHVTNRALSKNGARTLQPHRTS